MKKLLITLFGVLFLFALSFNASALCTDGPAENNGWCSLDHNGNYICQSYGGCSCTCDGNSPIKKAEN